MDSPQYEVLQKYQERLLISFKPYYKWIVLNTYDEKATVKDKLDGFKPYYKWIVLNTAVQLYI